MTLNPSHGRGVKSWIDPKLAAVYVIGNKANNLCKIGYARDLRKRVLGIQTSCPVPVHLVHFVHVVGSLVAKFVEHDLHAGFAPERRHGEWFDAKPAEVGDMLQLILTRGGYTWWDEQGRRELGFQAARVHQRDWERYSRRGHAHD